MKITNDILKANKKIILIGVLVIVGLLTCKILTLTILITLISAYFIKDKIKNKVARNGLLAIIFIFSLMFQGIAALMKDVEEIPAAATETPTPTTQTQTSAPATTAAPTTKEATEKPTETPTPTKEATKAPATTKTYKIDDFIGKYYNENFAMLEVTKTGLNFYSVDGTDYTFLYEISQIKVTGETLYIKAKFYDDSGTFQVKVTDKTLQWINSKGIIDYYYLTEKEV